MKKLMMAGGLLGFGTGLSLGLLQQSSWPSILWRASVACLCAGILTRWLGRVWVNAIREIAEQRLALEEKSNPPLFQLPPKK